MERAIESAIAAKGADLMMTSNLLRDAIFGVAVPLLGQGGMDDGGVAGRFSIWPPLLWF